MAQATRSPFSSFGIGDYFGSALAHSQGMAGVGVSNPQYWYLNNQNPALLVYNYRTVFEGGFIGEKRTVKGQGNPSEKNGGGNLNYLTIGFPVKLGKWSTSVGLMPYSNVNYKFKYTSSIEGSTNTLYVQEEGSGGINQAYWANGFKAYKNLSFGVKASYLFSSIEKNFQNEISVGQIYPIIPKIVETTYIKDLAFSGSFAFHLDSLTRKNHTFNVGGVYDLKTKLNTEFTQQYQRYGSLGVLIDSVTIASIKGKTTIPQIATIGISYGRPFYWTVGIDFTYLKYQNFRNFSGDNQGAKDTWRLALGTEFTPDPTTLGNYLKKMTYRTGVSYEELPYLANGSRIKDFGINFGLSLPVGRISSLDLALKVGKRGDLQNNTVEENYVKVYFGMTFNDQWFIKRKFD